MVRGPIAALHDLRDGRLLWSIEAEDDWGGASATPIFSPGGRLALTALPKRGDGYEVAVVSTHEGKILQEAHAPGDERAAFGFLDRGRRAWISFLGMVQIYDVQ